MRRRHWNLVPGRKRGLPLIEIESAGKTSAQLPQIEVVDMRTEFANKSIKPFSSVTGKITDRLARKEQIVLLLNRRGYSSFVMCRDCGYVLPCPNCDISLTLHMDTKTMRCHYCGHEEHIPIVAPIAMQTRFVITERVRKKWKKS